MSNQLDRSNTVNAHGFGAESHLSESPESRIARFERLGASLFQVEFCIVSFVGKTTENAKPAVDANTSQVRKFCDAMPPREGPVNISDMTTDPSFSAQALVVGTPFLRFFARVPLFDSTRQIIGSVSIFSSLSRKFDENQFLLLGDLAVLIEHEVTLTAMYQSHLELIKQNRNLKRESMTDPLLGTWNRSAIVRSLRTEMDRCSRAGKPLSLVLASWDQNAQIRNTYGVAATDILLLKIVSRMRSCIRPFDALGRYDNDIFLIVLPGASSLVVAAVIQRIKLAILSHPETVDNVPLSLDINVNAVSTDVFPDAEPEFLIAQAERNLLALRRAAHQPVASGLASATDITY